MKTKTYTVSGITDPVLETVFDDTVTRSEAELSLQAKQDGLRNIPLSAQQHEVGVLKPIESKMQGLIDQNYKSCQAVSDVAKVSAFRKDATDKISILTIEGNDLQRKHLAVKADAEALKKQLPETKKKPWLSPAIGLGLIEFGLTFSLLIGATSWPIAFFLSGAVGLLSVYGIRKASHYIMTAPDQSSKKRRWLTILAIGITAILLLAIWRAFLSAHIGEVHSLVQLQQPRASSSNFFTALPFAIISILAFVIGLALEMYYWISPEIKKCSKEYQDKVKEAQRLQEQCDANTQEIQSLTDQMRAMSEAVLRRQEYAHGFEKRVTALAERLRNQYESQNVQHRPDGQCPEFFGKPYTWTLTNYFTNIFSSFKQNSNEKATTRTPHLDGV